MASMDRPLAHSMESSHVPAFPNFRAQQHAPVEDLLLHLHEHGLLTRRHQGTPAVQAVLQAGVSVHHSKKERLLASALLFFVTF